MDADLKEETAHSVLNSLDEAGVKYVLMTDFLGGWKTNQHLELDIFIKKSDKNIFLDAIHKLGFARRKKLSNLPNHHFYLLWQSTGLFKLDVRYSVSFYDLESNLWVYSSQDELLCKNRVKTGKFYRPSNFHCILLYAAHCGFLERKRLEDRHISNLLNYIEDFFHELKDNEKEFAKELQYIVEQETKENIPDKIKNLLFPYFRKKFSFRIYTQKIFHFISCDSGPKILFLGTDGVGKSTLIKELENILPIKTARSYYGMGDDGWVIPQFKTFYAKYKNSTFKKFVHRIYWFLLYPLDLLLRRVLQYFKNCGRLSLIDRFPG